MKEKSKAASVSLHSRIITTTHARYSGCDRKENQRNYNHIQPMQKDITDPIRIRRQCRELNNPKTLLRLVQ